MVKNFNKNDSVMGFFHWMMEPNGDSPDLETGASEKEEEFTVEDIVKDQPDMSPEEAVEAVKEFLEMRHGDEQIGDSPEEVLQALHDTMMAMHTRREERVEGYDQAGATTLNAGIIRHHEQALLSGIEHNKETIATMKRLDAAGQLEHNAADKEMWQITNDFVENGSRMLKALQVLKNTPDPSGNGSMIENMNKRETDEPEIERNNVNFVASVTKGERLDISVETQQRFDALSQKVRDGTALENIASKNSDQDAPQSSLNEDGLSCNVSLSDDYEQAINNTGEPLDIAEPNPEPQAEPSNAPNTLAMG